MDATINPQESCSYLQQLKAFCEEYYQASWVLQGYRRPGTKFFGIGNGPKGDACHKKFAADVAAVASQMTEEHASPEDTHAVLEFILTEPGNKVDDQLVYWMLIAVHGSVSGLAGLLTMEDAAALRDLYDRLYPRKKRLPAQRELYTALQKAADGKEHG